ncbi:Ig-like domain-containing protein [Mangrovimicrobium sediminis]|uniref:Ig-like domain-containing protein n=1 Tax=Mangrovimicrobium sediminis TaxID=2562682 RepID=UPI001981F8AF|nr:type I secretion C-terminal target domain-containing protein [Haliea sp. SAOS-164]
MVLEGDVAQVTVTLSKASAEPVTVEFVTVDGTATVIGGDYDPLTGTITFAPGVTEVIIQIQTNVDDLEEPDEQFFIDLSNATNATIADPQGVVTIIDGNDPSPEVDVLYVDGDIGVVDESALDDGTDPASPTETTTGTFDIDLGGDTLQSLVINGVDVTAGGIVVGFYGVLTVTLSNGVYAWSYTLSDNTLNHNDPNSTGTFEGVVDSFTLIVTDDDGDSGSDTLFVQVTDDGPIAVDDVNSIAAGTYGPVGGNVITENDTVGADGASVVGVAAGDTGSTLVNAATLGTAIAGAYGVLTVFADGTYSYERNPDGPGGVEDVFTYTLRDGDGDMVTATITIDIADSGVIVDAPRILTENTTVWEAGLPARPGEPEGSDAAAPSESCFGVINFSAPDGTPTISINGQAVAAGDTIVTAKGILSIDSIDFTTGEIAYTYRLTDNSLDHPDWDRFIVKVTDADGDFARDVLRIAIIDDNPEAVDDFNSIAAGSYGPVTGNVMDNDTEGADGAQVVGVVAGAGNVSEAAGANVSAVIAGSYGMLTIFADGSYSYVRNPGTPGGVEDVFTYALRDGDGDISTATLTISIDDADVWIKAPHIGNEPTTVYESGLPARPGEPEGSDEAAPSESCFGTAWFIAPDGPATIYVDGFVATAGASFTGDYGTLTIDNINYATGEIFYTYRLTDNMLAEQGFDSFLLEVRDVDGDISQDVMRILIVDDQPIAVDDVNALAAGTYGPVGGDLMANDTEGADGAAVVGVAAGDTDTALDNTGTLGTAIAGAFGVLTVFSDGTYSYVRNPGTPGGVEDVFTYTLKDGDGDLVTATLTIGIRDAGVTIEVPEVGSAAATVYEAGLPVRPGEPEGSDAGSPSESTFGVVSFTAPDAPATITINGIPVTAGSVLTTAKGILTVDSINMATGEIAYTYRLTDNTLSDPDSDDFVIRVTDIDGDYAEKTLSIGIVDDNPTALDDFNTVNGAAYSAVSGNVMDNDTEGADGALVVGISAAGSATTLAVGAAAINITGAYGVLTIMEDGSYIYMRSPGSPGGVEDVFTYTLRDSDGDISTAELTITIGDANVWIKAPHIGNEPTTVWEAGLPERPGEPEGSDESSPSESCFGAVHFFAPDGPVTIKVDGMVAGIGDSFTGTYGTLTIDNINYLTGEIHYTYRLTDNMLADQGFDKFLFSVTDIDGDTAQDYMRILIVDDQPSALDDGNSIATGSVGPATGNVMDNDVQGADGASVVGVAAGDSTGSPLDNGTTVGTVIVGLYGMLTLFSDGSYSYTRNAEIPSSDDDLEDVFTYTLKDGDGDYATARLVITIGAEDNEVTLSIPELGGDSTTVYEEALDDGTNPDATTESVSGVMSFSALDGLASVTIDGTPVTAGDTVVTAKGILTIDSINAATGEIGYTYLLTGNTLVDPDSDSFVVRVTDTDGDYDEDTLAIAIVNDVPLEFLSDYVTVSSVSGVQQQIAVPESNSGSINFRPGDGADGFRVNPGAVQFNESGNVTDAFGRDLYLDDNQLSWFQDGDSLVARYFDGQAWVEGFTVTLDNTTDTFSVTDVSSGVFSVAGEAVPFAPAEDANGGNNDYYGLMNLGGTDVDVVFSNPAGTVNTDSANFGLNSNWIDPGQQIVLEFYTNSLLQEGSNSAPTFDGPAASAALNNFQIKVGEVAGGPSNRAQFIVTVYYADGSGTETWDFTSAANPTADHDMGSIAEEGVINLVAAQGFDKIVVQAVADTDDFSIMPMGFTPFLPHDVDMKLDVFGFDGDGDSAAGNIVFGIDQDGIEGIDPAPVGVSTTSFAQVGAGAVGILGTEVVADDGPLLATEGDDVFAFDLADAQEGGVTSISGFGESGSDALDLRDLLVGEEGADLSSYLHVSYDGANTVIEVSSTGAFTGEASDADLVDKTITLEGVDLVGSDELSSVIQDMLHNGQLITD